MEWMQNESRRGHKTEVWVTVAFNSHINGTGCTSETENAKGINESREYRKTKTVFQWWLR